MYKKILSLSCCLLLTKSIVVAIWIRPNWGNNPPKYEPRAFAWQEPTQSVPVLYRTIIEIKKDVLYSVIKVSAENHWYGFINGRYLPDSKDKIEEDFFLVDLTPYLIEGKNVFACTTRPEGFGIEGQVVYTDGTKERIHTDLRWKVWQFPALTVLESEHCMNVEFNDSFWYPVEQIPDKKQIKITDKEIINKYVIEESKRLKKQFEDTIWRAELINKKGIIIIDLESFGFGGKGRIETWIKKYINKMMTEKDLLQEKINSLVSKSNSITNFDTAEGKFFIQTKKLIKDYIDRIETISLWIKVNDEKNNLVNHKIYFTAINQTEIVHTLDPIITDLEKVINETKSEIESEKYQFVLIKLKESYNEIKVIKKDLEQKWGHKINEYNETIYNPMGWFDTNELFDSDIEKWGLRINPVETSWKINLDGKWRFRTDPKNVGIQEARHTFGYNIENQWQELIVPGMWEKQGVLEINTNAPDDTPYPGINIRTDGPYNGYAWYRKTLMIPQEWAGYDLELFVSSIDDWDWTYFNGTEIGHTGAKTENWWIIPRRYKVPREIVHFGGYNVIAFRIYDCGGDGGIGSVEIRCPALKVSYETRTQKPHIPTEIYSSPLSPGILLTTGEKRLTLWGWEQRCSAGPHSYIIPTTDRTEIKQIKNSGVIYETGKQKPFSSNWMLLWMDINENSSDLPIQLVFEEIPNLISVTTGIFGINEISFDFNRSGVNVLMIRPFREKTDIGIEIPNPQIIDKCNFWSKVLLAYPISYTEILKRSKNDIWELEVVDIYQYKIIKNSFGLDPIYLALLPPLVSYAIKTKFPGVIIPKKISKLGYNLGKWGELLGTIGTKYINYKIPISKIKRNIGFTSFCFGPTDIGVPGNIRELELIKATGANSYRPQHNQSGEQAEKLVKWCIEHGLNLTFNVDNNFASKPEIIDHYRKLAIMCKDYPDESIAYDLINEPANITPEIYNPLVKKITEEIRKIDTKHLIYIETPHSFASITEFANLNPTGDKLTGYSFHDYDFRLPQYWPNLDTDIRTILNQWIPAFEFMIKNHTFIYLGEYGAHEQTQNDPFHNPCTITLTLDMLKIMDQFNMHSEYYSNRGIVRIRSDGSIEESLVQEGYRRYFARKTANYYLTH